MILFYDDWEKYPEAIVDMKTKNQDFVRLSALYREMGVKNHAFILQLHNRDLQGVDPFNPPDAATALAIGEECKVNFWYFIREIARDPAGSDDFPILFKPNRGVISAYWLFFNHILFILIMIRQTGKSFGIDWLYTYLLNIGLTKGEIAMITKDEKLRGRELERLKAMEMTLPSYMKMRDKRDPANTEVLKISALENYFKVYLPNRSPKIADLIGRGMTASIAGADEIAYLANNFITLPVMLSATQAAREVSRIKGEPYGTIFTTTSGKRDTPEGKYAYKLVSDAAVWTEAFFDCKNLKDLEKTILASSPGSNLHVNCTFNHRQLGKTDEWLRARLKETLQEDQLAVEADYLNLWPSGTESSPFTQETAAEMRASEVLDFYTEISGPGMYALRWYYSSNAIQQIMKEEHILAIDSSDAVGRDGIGCVLTRVSTGEVAMAAMINKTNLISFAEWLCDFIKKYQKVTVIIERRSSGASILDYLLLYLPVHGINPFRRLYNTVVQEAAEYPERFREVQNIHTASDDVCTKYKKFFGWATSGTGATSRNLLYGRVLSTAASLGASSMRDRTLILQTLGLVVKDGRIDHQDGEHDDMVIAWLLAYWLKTMGKNLGFYGIESRDILSLNKVLISQKQLKSDYEIYLEKKAKEDFKRISAQLENEKDEYIARRLEYDLQQCISKLSVEEQQVVAEDDLINRLREKRMNQQRNGLGGYLHQGYATYSDRGFSVYDPYAGSFNNDTYIL